MPSEIEHVIKETLEGHQREIMAHMTVEEIYRKISISNIFDIFIVQIRIITDLIKCILYRERRTFSAKVFEVSSMDLVNMGVVVISYTIHDIKVIHYQSLLYFLVFAVKVCINECKMYLFLYHCRMKLDT